MLLWRDFIGGKYANGPNQGIECQFVGNFGPGRYLMCTNNADNYVDGLEEVNNEVKRTHHHDT